MGKKLFAAVLLLLSVCCAGCKTQGGQTPETGEVRRESDGQKDEEKLKIGISIYRYDDEFMALYRKELKKYLEEFYDAEVFMADAAGDQDRQNSQVEHMIQDDFSALIINPVTVNSISDMADRCAAAGIPLVVINREPREGEIERWKKNQMPVSYVGTNAWQAGAYQGEIILEAPEHGDVNGDGVVSYAMIMGDAESIDTKYRTEYSIRALEDGGMKTRQLFIGRGNWDFDQGKEEAALALSLFPDEIEVIFCNNDAMALGAGEAVREAGKTIGKDIYLVGVDALEEAVRAVKDGDMTGTVYNDYAGQAHAAAKAAVTMAQGGQANGKYMVDYIKITTVNENQ